MIPQKVPIPQALQAQKAAQVDLLATMEELQNLLAVANQDIADLKKLVLQQKNVSIPTEEAGCAIIDRLIAIDRKFEEHAMLCAMFYFQPTEQFNPDEVRVLSMFLAGNQHQIKMFKADLDGFFFEKQMEFKQLKLKERQEQMKQKSAESANADVEELFGDLQDGMKDSLKDIKSQQKEISMQMQVGEEKMATLQAGLKENTNTVKAATVETNKAMAALKKNKDLLFMLSALGVAVVGVIMIL